MKQRLTRRRLLTYSTVPAVAVAGCAGGGDSGGGATTAASGTETPTEADTTTTSSKRTIAGESVGIAVRDQTVDDSTVTVLRATIDDKGWLAIYPEAEGGGPKRSTVLAKNRLSRATLVKETRTYEELELDLGEEVTESATLYAMLHYDDPSDGDFTFPDEGDPPVTADGSPVVEPFDVTV